MDEERLDAYDGGYLAYYETSGYSPDNPYPADSEEYLDWADGYFDAVDESASEPL